MKLCSRVTCINHLADGSVLVSVMIKGDPDAVCKYVRKHRIPLSSICPVTFEKKEGD